MKKRIISTVLVGCMMLSPVSVCAEDVNVYEMSLEELQSAYLELQEKYNALLDENTSVPDNDNEPSETSIETGNFIFTLNSVVQCNSIPGAFGDELPDNPQNVFLIFNVTAENAGTEDEYINIFYSSGYVDGYAIDPSTLLAADLESFAGDVAVGRKRSGDIVFEVSSDWKEFEYLYYNKHEDVKASYIVTPDTVSIE